MTSSKPPTLNKPKQQLRDWVGLDLQGPETECPQQDANTSVRLKTLSLAIWRFTRTSSLFARSAYVIINPTLILGPLHLGLPVVLVNLHEMMILGALPTGIYPWEVQPWKAECERPDKEHPPGFPWRDVNHPALKTFADRGNRKLLNSWGGMIFCLVSHLGTRK